MLKPVHIIPLKLTLNMHAERGFLMLHKVVDHVFFQPKTKKPWKSHNQTFVLTKMIFQKARPCDGFFVLYTLQACPITSAIKSLPSVVRTKQSAIKFAIANSPSLQHAAEHWRYAKGSASLRRYAEENREEE